MGYTEIHIIRTIMHIYRTPRKEEDGIPCLSLMDFPLNSFFFILLFSSTYLEKYVHETVSHINKVSSGK